MTFVDLKPGQIYAHAGPYHADAKVIAEYSKDGKAWRKAKMCYLLPKGEVRAVEFKVDKKRRYFRLRIVPL